MRRIITTALLLALVLQAGVEVGLLGAEAERNFTGDENDFYSPIALGYRAEVEREVASIEPAGMESLRIEILENRVFLPDGSVSNLSSSEPRFASMIYQP